MLAYTFEDRIELNSQFSRYEVAGSAGRGMPTRVTGMKIETLILVWTKAIDGGDYGFKK